jgi:hypothetical protein
MLYQEFKYINNLLENETIKHFLSILKRNFTIDLLFNAR